MQTIKELYSLHKHWIGIVRKFGELQFAEDIVQEAYVKVLTTNKEINFAYFYLILRSLTMNLHKAKVIKIQIENIADYSDEEAIDIDELTKPILDFIKTWEDYDRLMFMIWVNKGISMRKMSRESGIPFMSIYNTIKNCKLKIKQWQKKQKDLAIQ